MQCIVQRGTKQVLLQMGMEMVVDGIVPRPRETGWDGLIEFYIGIYDSYPKGYGMPAVWDDWGIGLLDRDCAIPIEDALSTIKSDNVFFKN